MAACMKPRTLPTTRRLRDLQAEIRPRASRQHRIVIIGGNSVAAVAAAVRSRLFDIRGRFSPDHAPAATAGQPRRQKTRAEAAGGRNATNRISPSTRFADLASSGTVGRMLRHPSVGPGPFHLPECRHFFLHAQRELAALEDPKMREANERQGDGHGVNLTRLRELAKRLKTQHELALELWATGDAAARLLSTLACKPRAFAPRLAHRVW
jgi:DNA alkylation repair enzyme